MIKYIEGNLFDSSCQTLVNPVNCVGVMGKGIALRFKTKFPMMFLRYEVACRTGILKNGGDLWLYCRTPVTVPDLFNEDSDTYPQSKILCFATKEHWRNHSKMTWIERGLQTFRENYKEWDITSAAFPKLGCTNGGLKWQYVRPLMEKYLGDLDIPIKIHL